MTDRASGPSSLSHTPYLAAKGTKLLVISCLKNPVVPDDDFAWGRGQAPFIEIVIEGRGDRGNQRLDNDDGEDLLTSTLIRLKPNSFPLSRWLTAVNLVISCQILIKMVIYLSLLPELVLLLADIKISKLSLRLNNWRISSNRSAFSKLFNQWNLFV